MWLITSPLGRLGQEDSDIKTAYEDFVTKKKKNPQNILWGDNGNITRKRRVRNFTRTGWERGWPDCTFTVATLSPALLEQGVPPAGVNRSQINSQPHSTWQFNPASSPSLPAQCHKLPTKMEELHQIQYFLTQTKHPDFNPKYCLAHQIASRFQTEGQIESIGTNT